MTSKTDIVPDRLTIFTFLWACQALVHQDFFRQWADVAPVLGWILTITIMATLLFPRSLYLFSGMISLSVIYNVGVRWPFVANHIFLETLLNFVILGAIIPVVIRGYRANTAIDTGDRNEIFDRLAPVLGSVTVLLYYLIFVTKLNWDFIDLESSCVTLFYDSVLNRFSFLPLPTGDRAYLAMVWLFLAVEIVLPVLLTFRKTRYSAFVIALPFHLVLGLIGHRTFSAFIFALYGLFCADSISKLIAAVRAKLGQDRITQVVRTLRFLFIFVTLALYFYYFMAGGYDAETGQRPLRHFGYRAWYTWSMLIIILYFSAIGRSYLRRDSLPTPFWSPRPGYLWLMLPLVFLNAMSPYLGLKTESSFAMYSSLRTEGEWNNHFFMPALRLTGYQDDLVEILETDNPMVQKMMYTGIKNKRKTVVTYFELRRVVSESTADFYVTYSRGGEVHQYRQYNGVNNDPDLARRHPLLLSKLLYFRPITAGDKEYCKH